MVQLSQGVWSIGYSHESRVWCIAWVSDVNAFRGFDYLRAWVFAGGGFHLVLAGILGFLGVELGWVVAVLDGKHAWLVTCGYPVRD